VLQAGTAPTRSATSNTAATLRCVSHQHNDACCCLLPCGVGLESSVTAALRWLPCCPMHMNRVNQSSLRRCLVWLSARNHTEHGIHGQTPCKTARVIQTSCTCLLLLMIVELSDGVVLLQCGLAAAARC
jgi:hypothetical protein